MNRQREGKKVRESKFPQLSSSQKSPSSGNKVQKGQKFQLYKTLRSTQLEPKRIFEPNVKNLNFITNNSNHPITEPTSQPARKSRLFAFERYIKRYNIGYNPHATFLHQMHPRVQEQYSQNYLQVKDRTNNSKASLKSFRHMLKKEEQEKSIGQTDSNLLFSENLSKKNALHSSLIKNQAVNGLDVEFSMNFVVNFQQKNKNNDKSFQHPFLNPIPQISQLKRTEPKPLNLTTRSKNPTQSKNKYKYYIGWGNNEVIVKEVLSLRPCWQQTTEHDTIFNLRWQTQTQKSWYTRISMNRYRQYVNHVENHEEISTKSGLVRSLRKYCGRKLLNCWNWVPVSFVFDFDDGVKFEAEMKRFVLYFCENAPMQMEIKYRKQREYIEFIKHIGSLLPAKPNLSFENINIQYLPQLSGSYMDQSNKYLWLFKPSQMNRGRGIRIFNSLESLSEIIKTQEQQINYVNDTANNFHKKRQFVLQKYIEKPLLLRNRKFDIRVWIMIAPRGETYFFKEGYIRTSSQFYSLEEQDNTYVHLTNNAIQKNSSNYGKYEQANQLSFHEFDHLFENYPQIVPFHQIILPKIKNICAHVLESGKKKLRNEKNQCGFEIFGVDFMLDADGGLWLIEVNTNPCLEIGSKLLGCLIPRMLDDCFRIVLDSVFRRKENQEGRRFQVEGYKDDENLWEGLKVEE